MRFAVVLLLATAASGEGALAQSSTTSPCASAEHRQFDFWVGEWDVYPTGKDVAVAASRIEKLYGDCVIRENWMPRQGSLGGSLNMYDARAGVWRQTWADSSGSWVEFSGGLVGEAMVLTGLWRGGSADGKDNLTRMTYTRNPDGSVRQLGEASTDQGKSWAPSFDFTYRPSARIAN
jgi:hypothetical protein